MSEKLLINKQITDNCVNISLEGSIDEDSNFEELLQLGQKEYHFNFDKITMINSCGIRTWISFIEKLPDDAKIVYSNCPQIVIEQMNMVHGFIRKGATIESFYAPYFCEECDLEKKVLLKVDQVQGTNAPTVMCDQCEKEMEFDDIEEQYFNFLKQK